MPNWRNDQDYDFTETLCREHWAWEFLRRNHQYQQEWRRFMDVWQALERDYGQPPERDYQAWKQDPRAYVSVTEEASASDCRVDEEHVLIECALGARWGFYKFPLDPAQNLPELGIQLSWREIPQGVIRVAAESDYTGHDPARIALGFDLDLPLREQLERAKRFLLATQRGRVRDGLVVPRTVEKLRGHWRRALRCLDAMAEGVDTTGLAAALCLDPAETAGLCQQAQQLCDAGYREILLLPER